MEARLLDETQPVVDLIVARQDFLGGGDVLLKEGRHRTDELGLDQARHHGEIRAQVLQEQTRHGRGRSERRRSDAR